MSSHDGVVPSGLYGLVLAGGQSKRMGRDKANLSYHGRPQLLVTFDLIDTFCETTFVSVARDQTQDPLRSRLPQIVDSVTLSGPGAGMVSAHQKQPNNGWLVMACDLPWATSATLEKLINSRRIDADATAFVSSHDGLPEPLCAIWEPSGLKKLESQIRSGRSCPRKCLINANTHLVPQDNPSWLDNINSQKDLESSGLIQ